MSTSPPRRARRGVLIRAAEPRDLDALHDLWRAPGVVAGTLKLPHLSRADAEERLARASEDSRMLVAEVDGRVVGEGSLQLGKRRRRHVASVGLCVHDAHVGRGVGGTLLDALLALGERWLGVLRWELEVFVDNRPAVQLYRARGFEIEGIERAYALRDGALVDVFRMARLAGALPWPRITAEDVANRPAPQLPPGPAEPKRRGRGGRGLN
jgi:putative acetyltransferase